MAPTSGVNWLALLVIGFLFILITGIFMGQGIVVAFGTMGLAAAAISMAWNRIALEELSYELNVTQNRAQVDEVVPISVTLVNKKPVPLVWVKAEDEFPDAVKLQGGDVVENSNTKIQTLRHLTSMGWYERIRWDYSIRCTRRGLYHMGPVLIESGDPFGFIRTRKMEQHRSTILVLPRVVPLEQLGLPAAMPLGEVRGGARIFEDLTRPSGLRDYQKGDPLTKVDWKATAKAGRLLVRTYDPSSTMNVIIAVAVDTTEPYWRIALPEELDRVVTVAASVASYVAERDYTFGLFSNDMAVQVRRSMRVPPSQGREQLGEVMAALATVPPLAAGPMAAHLAEHGRRFPLGATVVLCSASITQDMVATLSDLTIRGLKIVVVYTGVEDLPEMPERVLAYSLREHLVRMEAAARYGGGE